MRDIDCKNSERAIVLVHSSDLHIDDDIEPHKYNGLEGLRYVLSTAKLVGADLVMLAGDTFDNGRVATEVARQAGEIIATAQMPVVLLPGNHDPALPDGIFHRSGILDLAQAMVIGHTHPERIVLEHLDLEILGRPHRSYCDMPPLPTPMPRQARWQVIMAHGHFVQPSDWEDEAHRSWLISEAELGAMGADYVALGHWDRPVAVGDGRVPAYYSGAPDLAETVNVIRLDHQNGVTVERKHLGMPYPRRW
jgi:DNA repair exonuclease SbcCD nuclease subunit